MVCVFVVCPRMYVDFGVVSRCSVSQKQKRRFIFWQESSWQWAFVVVSRCLGLRKTEGNSREAGLIVNF